MKKTLNLLVSILMSLVLLTSVSAYAQDQSIVVIAVSNPDISILVAALQKAELVEALQGEGSFHCIRPDKRSILKTAGRVGYHSRRPAESSPA